MKRKLDGARNTRWSVGAAVVAIVSMVLTGCAPGLDAARPDVVVSAFNHVHGLGVDSVSGVAYAATHEGVFILPPLESATVSVLQLGGPISGRVQDTMAFTVQGSRMYASGHPGLDDAAKGALPNLGLITSLDGATTWETLSLGGEADFHDLAVVADPSGTVRIYGYNAGTGTVMFSGDGGNSWTVGAKLALRDLAADPTQPGTVYATTAEGLAISTDNGASFALVPDAPALYLVDTWQNPADVGLVGIATDGQVWVKTGAENWRATSGVVEGEAEAMVYTSSPTPTLLIADRRGIVVSDDFGVTWRVLVAK